MSSISSSPSPTSAASRSAAAATLAGRGVTVTRGDRTILRDVDLTVAAGRRVALVGPNGVGKSTLLGVLAGEVPTDAGAVTLAPPTATVGLLAQEPERGDSETVRQLLTRRTGVAAAQAELDAATAAVAADPTAAADRYDLALQRWLALGASDLDARVGEVWRQLGLADRLLDQPTASLSGGEAARASLAALELSSFDVYLLDEPTNDLDLESLDRLEAWVLAQRAPMVLVSHDRRFMERVVTHVVELDEFSHTATEYAGGWAAFLDARETARRHEWERYERYDAERRQLARRAQREREWASQGQAKVRRSDESDKHIRAFKINQTEHLAGKAARTERALERLEEVAKPRQPWQLRFEVPDAGRSGDIVARLSGVVVERGEFRLGPVDLLVEAGDRIALVGPNGAGKSTLLDVLLGRTTPTAGTATLGSGVVAGEIEQVRTQLAGDPALGASAQPAGEGRASPPRVRTDPDAAPQRSIGRRRQQHSAPRRRSPQHGSSTLLRAFTDATGMTVAEARTLLAKFGLVADHVTRATESLSPGERTRAALALLMANGANLLVLDEPTNHLDLAAIEELESALDAFAGTIVLVTHDRTLLDAFHSTCTVTLRDGRIV